MGVRRVPWSSGISTRCSPSPRKGRSRPPPTRWRPSSRTYPTRCASSKPSSACRCSCAAARGPSPRSSASLVLERARRVDRELEAMRADLALLQGLDAGYARLGVVGTASRWLVPALVADLRDRAPGVRLRVNEGASERLFTELVDGELAQAVVTEPVDDRRLVVEHLLEEELIGLVGRDVELPREPVPLAEFAQVPAGAAAGPQPAAHRGRPRRRGERDQPDRTGRGRRHPAHRRPRGGRRLRVDPPRDRHPARAAPTCGRSPSPACRRVGWQWCARATRSCRSPTRPCATACATWWRSTCVCAASSPRSRYGRATKRG